MNKYEKDEYYMSLAISLAKEALEQGEIPVGAVIVFNDEIIATGKNTKETNFDPSGHAEINAIKEASKKLKNWRLSDCTLYVTLEPCPMCSSLIAEARISRICFGAYDIGKGGISRPYNIFNEFYKNTNIQIKGGILEKECKELLDQFFKNKRQ